MACDYRQAAIFQMTGPAANPVTDGSVLHQDAGAPGNCSRGLGFKSPMDCTPSGTAYTFVDNAQVVRLSAGRWFVANNGRGGNSLFRVALRGNAVGAAEEVVDGVTDMQLTYLLPLATAYVPASAIPATRWRDVTAVRLQIVLAGTERVDPANGAVINRTLEHTVTLRSRNT